MKHNNFLIGKESRERIFSGIKQCADIVGGTMGTAGGNGSLETIEYPFQLLTNDGITILESLDFGDLWEQRGRNILLEAVRRSNKASGDASSTCVVLTSAIIEEGLKRIKDAPPMDIKNSLEECFPIIQKSIQEQTKPVVKDNVIDLNLLEQVATISAEDSSIGKMITDIYSKIGQDGIIHWDISKTFEDHYAIGEGISVYDAKLLSPYMADMDNSGNFQYTTRIKNPNILLIKQKITGAGDLSKMCEALARNDIKELVVFADEVDPLVIPGAVNVRFRSENPFRIIIVKMPTLWKDWWYEDLAKATGATLIDGVGLTLKNANLGHLGQVKDISITREETHLDGIKDVSEHIKFLETDGSDDAKIRISRLNTKTARYFVGAPSDSALSYRRLKVEDAIGSAYNAIRGGVVAGGGTTLIEAAKNLPNTIGGDILRKALYAPAVHIVRNAGENEEIVKNFENGIGFNTKTKSLMNMFDGGIVDSSLILVNAIQNSLSVSASFLTQNVATLLPRPQLTEQILQEIANKQR